MSWERYRWMVVDDHIARFNDHRERNFYPSDKICVDESMARWYGQGITGSTWVFQCTLQLTGSQRTVATRVMIRLKLFKTAEEVHPPK
jgi:hypothetical protein